MISEVYAYPRTLIRPIPNIEGVSFQLDIYRQVLPLHVLPHQPAVKAENGVSDHEESGAAQNRVRTASIIGSSH